MKNFKLRNIFALLACVFFGGSAAFAQLLADAQRQSNLNRALSEKQADVMIVDADPINLVTSPKMRNESGLLVLCMEKGHYLHTPVRDLDIREFIRQYMIALDFSRMFFTAADVQHYQDSLSPMLANLLKQGVLLPANKIYYETFVPRANARLEWIRERMKKPFDFSDASTFAPDRSKASWPKDEKEADELWEKRIKFDVLNQIIGYSHAETQLAKELDEEGAAKLKEEESDGEAPPKTYEEKLEKAKAEVLKRYENIISNLVKNDAIEVQELYLNALSNLYDPHSSFLSEYALEEFEISVRNSLVGIGAVLQDKDGYCTIVELMLGGPAEKSKELKEGDKIVGVAQDGGEFVDVVGKKLRNIVKLIRGKKDTVVRLQVESKDSPGIRREVKITRDEIQLTTKLAKAEIFQVPVGDRTIPVGVIDLPAFYGENETENGAKGFSTTKDVEELIGKLKARGVKGLILDMRKNGGGFLNEAIDLAGLFIRTGPVLQVREGTGRVNHLRDDNPKVAWDGPLIVLVSRLSASAAEIVAGALQNHERAIIVGDKNTFGKGTVQVVYHLSNFDKMQKSAAKVTIQKWYLPNGESIQVKGVASDITLPSIFEAMPELGEDKKEHVLPWDSIDPVSIRAGFGYGEGENGAKLREDLLKKSLERQKNLDEFKFLNGRIDWLKKRQDMKDWSLNLEAREAQLKADDEYADKMEAKQREFAKSNFKSEEILLDSAIAKEKEAEKKAAEGAKSEAAAKKGEAAKAGAEAASGKAKAAEAPKSGGKPEASKSGEGDSKKPDSAAGDSKKSDSAEGAKDSSKASEADSAKSDEAEAKSKSSDSEKGKEDDEDDIPEFDVQLREALRIMGDWLEMKEQKQTTQPKNK